MTLAALNQVDAVIVTVPDDLRRALTRVPKEPAGQAALVGQILGASAIGLAWR